ncbi:hypothetical protein M5K25_001416 [Dendrobium thyrsiflorum]|uniref:DUF4283 domain-containing protein n=1 Tax=Dendrobium thyrsiflorum TaxID=117978 RepID=A0ABD0W1J0_DENTH
MAALRHVDPGFLAGSSMSRSFVEALSGSSSSSSFPDLKQSTFSGFPALMVSEEEFFALAEPFRFSLVGFFPSKRPSLASILHGIGLLFGNPLKVDNATAVGLRTSVARVLVEIDVTKKFTDKIWLGPKNFGYFQQVVLEDLPLFYDKCNRLGHSSDSCCPAVHAMVVGEFVESDIQLGGGLANQEMGVIADSRAGSKLEANVSMPEEAWLIYDLGAPIDWEQLGNGCDVGSASDLAPSVCSDVPVVGGLELFEINGYDVGASEGIIVPGIMISSPLCEGDEPLSKSISDPVFTVPITLVPREALHLHLSRDSEVLHAERIVGDTTPDDDSFYEEDLNS